MYNVKNAALVYHFNIQSGFSVSPTAPTLIQQSAECNLLTGYLLLVEVTLDFIKVSHPSCLLYNLWCYCSRMHPTATPRANMHANMSAHIWVMWTGLRRQRQSFCRSCNGCWYIAVEREPRWASELNLSVGTHTKDSVWGGSNWIYASLVPLRPTPAPILQILPLFLTLLSFISPLSARRSWLQETHGTYVCRCRQIWACYRHMLWHVTTSLGCKT